MPELLFLNEAATNANEQSVLDCYLSITKNIIKCTDTNEKKLIFYVYDNEHNFYKKTDVILTGKIFREEMLSVLSEEVKTFDKSNFKKLCKLIAKIGTHTFTMNCIKMLASMVYDKYFANKLDACRDTVNFRNGIV